MKGPKLNLFEGTAAFCFQIVLFREDPLLSKKPKIKSIGEVHQNDSYLCAQIGLTWRTCKTTYIQGTIKLDRLWVFSRHWSRKEFWFVTIYSVWLRTNCLEYLWFIFSTTKKIMFCFFDKATVIWCKCVMVKVKEGHGLVNPNPGSFWFHWNYGIIKE